MQKKTVIVLLFLLAGIFLVSCGPAPNVKTGWDYWPPDHKYLVFGRVANFAHQPVEDVDVVLVRRKAKSDNPETGSTTSPANDEAMVEAEFLVASTDRGGEYSFDFEPWGAYDVWLYFDGFDQGYKPQWVQLNYFMRDRVGRGQGKSPVAVDIILEPYQQ